VFTADPRIVPTARKVDHTSYEEMLELAANGAKVLAPRSVEYARRYGVPIHVRSSFTSDSGTMVTGHATVMFRGEEITLDPNLSIGGVVEAPIISGVAHDRSEAKITVMGVPDVPGTAALIFERVAGADANIDMIVQNASRVDGGVTDISFTLPDSDVPKTLAVLEAAKDEIGYEALQHDAEIGKLSLIGAGMRSNPGVSAKLFAALRDAGINIEMITTSEIRISVVTRAEALDDAVRAVHTAFDLDSNDGAAVVYAGTGR
jgi:aspartate kinase